LGQQYVPTPKLLNFSFLKVFLFFIYALKKLELICNSLNLLKIGPQGVGTHVSQPPSSAADDDDGGWDTLCPNPLMTNF
jgi:hypothetical protein